MTENIQTKKILFVDDEPGVLESMERLFFDMDDDWEMTFAQSGSLALEYMKDQAFDVVISDMKMPEMNGAELLAKVKKLYPSTVRFILSGYSEKETIFKAIGSTDQFLLKPCDPEVVKARIENVLDSQKMIGNRELRGLASQMTSLPVLPEIYVQLEKTIKSDNSTFQDVANIVQTDVALTAKVLQLVNSAFFGLKSHIEDLQSALSYIGIETLKTLVLTTGVFGQFSQKEIKIFKIDKLYEHSLNTSVLARHIMKTLTEDQKSQELAGMAGMLLDIGQLIFIRNKPGEYKKIIDRAEAEQKPLFMVEHEVFQATHAHIGAYLMQTWGLPKSIVRIIYLHHSSYHALKDRLNPMAAVYMAAAITNNEMGNIQCDPEYDLNKQYLTRMELIKYSPEWGQVAQSIIEIQE